MGTMASLITSLTSVYSTVHPGADQRKHQSSASLAFVRGIHRRPVNSPHKWPVTRKMFPFDDVIMDHLALSVPANTWYHNQVIHLPTALYTVKHHLTCKWMIASWWRHQMETFSALLALCAGNSPVPVNSPHKGQWRGALMFSLICARINDWVNNREAGDLRRHRGHCDVNVMFRWYFKSYDILETIPIYSLRFTTKHVLIGVWDRLGWKISFTIIFYIVMNQPTSDHLAVGIENGVYIRAFKIWLMIKAKSLSKSLPFDKTICIVTINIIDAVCNEI